MINWLRRERAAFLSITGRGDAFPPAGTLVETIAWKLHNLRVWWRNLIHPLSAEDKQINNDDLLSGK